VWRVPLVARLLLAYIAFVSLGLPDAVLGVAWPSLRAAFGLSQSALGAALRDPRVRLQAAIFFVYTGLEASAGLVLLGFSLAPIFPMLMSRTPDRLGAGLTAHAVGFQVAAATLGVAALPSGHGVVADAFGPGAIPVVLTGVAAILAALHALLERIAPLEKA
jgi:hypothetical protein